MDLESFRAGSVAELPPNPRRKPGRKGPRATQPFLRGPIPLAWLATAHAAGGSALAVGVALWFQRGVRGDPGPVKMTSAVRRRLGLSADQTRRGLRALESGGLAKILLGGRGRCTVVEVLAGPLGPAHKPGGRRSGQSEGGL
jgi:hypothetical protein